MKHTGPLWESGRSRVFRSASVLLRNREEYLPQLELIRAESVAGNGLPAVCFAGAYGRPGLHSLSSERCALPVRLVFAYQHLPYERLCRRSVAEPSCRQYRHRIPFREVSKIRSRFMNPEEEAGIDKEHETEHLLLHWCAKRRFLR